MSTVIEPVRGAREQAPNRVRWTRDQCDALREAGILTGRYELVDGEIISKMGQKPPHTAAIGHLLEWLVPEFGISFVRSQATIDVSAADPDYSDPEPDVALTRLPVSAFHARHPEPEDLLLVVEVSDSTLRFDLTKKVALYARAGLQEYWVLDLNGRQLFVHRQPIGDGYVEVTACGPDEIVATLARPEVSVRVGDLLP